MKLLEERILEQGKALGSEVLLVDAFLNHQVDCRLMYELGGEFKRLFENDKITRVITIEASGIAPAAMTALQMGLPLVFMKKQASLIMNDGLLQTEVFSFTKQKSYQLSVKKEFIKEGDRVLFIDDFLANGEAARGAIRLIEQAGAKVAGIGAVICKRFQGGYQYLADAGYHVEALASIAEMGDGYVKFEG
ncbi:MAG: xanthine phosphoribosyltransferase [Clostridia bacterium]|nr:xanthine phosphoribosyltransferase [Clostridia bacterium]